MVIIPVWFYGFDAAMYCISALIGFLLSFYFYRLFSINSEKTHKYLYLGFLVLSIGFVAISISDTFSYAAYTSCHNMQRTCILSIIDNAFLLDDYAYLAYFGLSLIAYFLFIRAYSKKYFSLRTSIIASAGYLFAVAIYLSISEEPLLWYSYNGSFHIIAFIMLAYVSFKNLKYYTETRRFNSFIVAFSFSMISLFHLLHIFVSLSGWAYVLAHVFLLIGFISLLAMVLRVNALVKKSGNEGLR